MQAKRRPALAICAAILLQLMGCAMAANSTSSGTPGTGLMSGQLIAPNTRTAIQRRAVEMSPSVSIFYMEDVIGIGPDGDTSICIEQVGAGRGWWWWVEGGCM